MSKRGKFGLLVGLLAGSAFGLLFAPRKGKELRSKLKKELKDEGTAHKTLLKELKTVGKDVKDAAVEAYDETGMDDKVDELKAKAVKKAKTVKKKAEAEVKKAKSKIKKEVKKRTGK